MKAHQGVPLPDSNNRKHHVRVDIYVMRIFYFSVKAYLQEKNRQGDAAVFGGDSDASWS